MGLYRSVAVVEAYPLDFQVDVTYPDGKGRPFPIGSFVVIEDGCVDIVAPKDFVERYMPADDIAEDETFASLENLLPAAKVEASEEVPEEHTQALVPQELPRSPTEPFKKIFGASSLPGAGMPNREPDIFIEASSPQELLQKLSAAVKTQLAKRQASQATQPPSCAITGNGD